MQNKKYIPRPGYGTVQRDIMTMEISLHSKAVYCLLATYTGDKEACFPSLNTICSDLKISKPTVIKSLKELESNNLLIIKKSKKKGSKENDVNLYIPLLLMVHLEQVDEDLFSFGGKGDLPRGKGGLPQVVKEVYRKNNSIKNNIEESNKKKRVFSPPTIEEVKAYFNEKGYTEESAIRAFNYYEAGEWSDGRGNKVKSWKQKMVGVWFKPENKKPSEQIDHSQLSNSMKRRMGLLPKL